MKKATLLWIAAVVVAGFAGAAGTRSTRRIQTVYQQQPNGEWQVYIFGMPTCPGPVWNTQVIYAMDPTKPVEIECDSLPVQTPDGK